MKHSGIRDWLEEREELLSPLAAKSRHTRGRQVQEEPSPMRTDFQRDRDRIIHSKSFRRLKHKTQVFISPTGDHFVTRLTHTLEVAQIARTISRGLNLNEDLTEAICLGHDLGHTPFGHAGEEGLAEMSSEGFRHNEQSLRVVDVLEKEGHGLNLTWEVREGILKHSKTRESILAEGWGTASTLEGQICKIADSVAYINHDIDDAIRAGVICQSDLPSRSISQLGESHARRIDTLVSDIIDYSWWATGQEPATLEEHGGVCDPAISMSPQILESADELREFLFQKVYNHPAVLSETEKAKRVVITLFDHYANHFEQLPDEYRTRGDSAERIVSDYIAGMTDHFAIGCFERLVVPKLWVG